MSETKKIQLSENGKFDLKAIKTAIENIVDKKIDHLENSHSRKVARIFLSEITSRVELDYDGLASIVPILNQTSASIAVFTKALDEGKELETLKFLTGKSFPGLVQKIKKDTSTVKEKPNRQSVSEVGKMVSESNRAKPVIERIDLSLIDEMKGKTSAKKIEKIEDNIDSKENEQEHDEAKSEE